MMSSEERNPFASTIHSPTRKTPNWQAPFLTTCTNRRASSTTASLLPASASRLPTCPRSLPTASPSGPVSLPGRLRKTRPHPTAIKLYSARRFSPLSPSFQLTKSRYLFLVRSGFVRSLWAYPPGKTRESPKTNPLSVRSLPKRFPGGSLPVHIITHNRSVGTLPLLSFAHKNRLTDTANDGIIGWTICRL